jgi:hypothetical protein
LDFLKNGAQFRLLEKQRNLMPPSLTHDPIRQRFLSGYFKEKTLAPHLCCLQSEAMKNVDETGQGPRPFTRGEPRSIKWF